MARTVPITVSTAMAETAFHLPMVYPFDRQPRSGILELNNTRPFRVVSSVAPGTGRFQAAPPASARVYFRACIRRLARAGLACTGWCDDPLGTLAIVRAWRDLHERRFRGMFLFFVLCGSPIKVKIGRHIKAMTVLVIATPNVQPGSVQVGTLPHLSRHPSPPPPRLLCAVTQSRAGSRRACVEKQLCGPAKASFLVSQPCLSVA